MSSCPSRDWQVEQDKNGTAFCSEFSFVIPGVISGRITPGTKLKIHWYMVNYTYLENRWTGLSFIVKKKSQNIHSIHNSRSAVPILKQHRTRPSVFSKLSEKPVMWTIWPITTHGLPSQPININPSMYEVLRKVVPLSEGGNLCVGQWDMWMPPANRTISEMTWQCFSRDISESIPYFLMPFGDIRGKLFSNNISKGLLNRNKHYFDLFFYILYS